MKPGSLVAYIGGQEPLDILDGYGLNEDEIYVVDKIGWAMLGFPPIKTRVLVLAERPSEVHCITMFREIQPPGEVDFKEFFKEPTKEKQKKLNKI